MKKKIIGIILTVVMVLTMLPAITLPTLAEGYTITDKDGNKADPVKDYYDDGGTIYIYRTDLKISGEVLNENIEIGNEVKEITFDNVNIVQSGDKANGIVEKAIEVNGEELTIKLSNKNSIGNIPTYDAEGNIIDEYSVRVGIYSKGTIKFTGEGSINIYAEVYGIQQENPEANVEFKQIGKVHAENNQNIAIFSGGDIDILGGEVKVISHGGQGIMSKNGDVTINNNSTVNIAGDKSVVQVEKKLTIKSSTVTVESNGDAIKTNEGGVEIKDSEVTVTATVGQGIDSGNNVIIENSTVGITSAGNAIHSNGGNGSSEIKILGSETVVNLEEGTGIHSVSKDSAEVNVTIEDATVNIYPEGYEAISVSGDINIGGEAKVTINTIEGEDKDTEINNFLGMRAAIKTDGNISIEDEAVFNVKATREKEIAMMAMGDLNIDTSGLVDIRAEKNGAVAIYGNIEIADTITEVVMYGSFNLEYSPKKANVEPKTIKIEGGALTGINKVDIAKGLLLYGAVDEDINFVKEKITKTAIIKQFELAEPLQPSKDVKIKEYYTCVEKEKEELANVLIIKAPEKPTTPVNPKTEDTGAMIIWAFAGLAALAVAAGILVSRKQKGKN